MKQELKLLTYLKKHNGITAMEASDILRISRCSAIIYNLKGEGAKVSKIREYSVNSEGNNINYDRYFIDNLDEMLELNDIHIPHVD